MPGKVVSKTLAQNDAVSVTLFAFEKRRGDRMIPVPYYIAKKY